MKQNLPSIPSAIHLPDDTDQEDLESLEAGNGTLDVPGKPCDFDTPRLDVWLNLGPATEGPSGPPSALSLDFQHNPKAHVRGLT